MSYDVWLEADLGSGEPVGVGDLNANYTYNVAPMFFAVLSEGPNQWNGLPATEVAHRCGMILAAFEADPAKFQAMNPANGWGDFDGAANFIGLIKAACEKAPQATVRVC